MGAEDDEEARRRRAARLREDVRATIEAEKPGGRRGAPSVRPRSPRDFVHERMRELDRTSDEKKD
jgi:hypothetical protein